MTSSRRRAVSLLIAVAVAAVGSGIFVGIRGTTAPPLRVGALAPDFSLATLEGPASSLSEFRGHVIFVNFWATWCAPCREEAPSLDRLYRRFPGEDFEILAVSIDRPGSDAVISAFEEEFDLSFPILLDPEQRAYVAYKASGVPETFLIGIDGHLIERFIGPRNWDQPRYVNAVRRLLDG